MRLYNGTVVEEKVGDGDKDGTDVGLPEYGSKGGNCVVLLRVLGLVRCGKYSRGDHVWACSLYWCWQR